MTDHQNYNSTTHMIVRLEDDYNNIRDHAFEKTAAYIIRKNGSYYEAIKGGTSTNAGTIVYGGALDVGGATGTSLHAVLEATITGGAGAHIHLAGSDYSLADEVDIAAAASGTWLTGDGKDTKLTQTTVDKAAFKITSATNVRLTGMYLYGTGAGTGCGVVATTTSDYFEAEHLICENWGYHGIQIVNSGTVNIHDCRCTSNIRNGLDFDTVTTSTVRNNVVNNNTRHGIYLDDVYETIIRDNVITSNDSANSATYDGVSLASTTGNSNYNTIEGNTILNNDRYEIYIGAGCTGNHVGYNEMTVAAPDRQGIIVDLGTNTRLRTFTMPFVGGTTQLTADAAAWGYEIDLANEFAVAYGTLPFDLQEVVRWRVYAQSIVLEAHGMELDVSGQGGSDNAAYNAQTVAVASEGSVSTNFAANDWIYWQFDAADDADLDDFVGGDHIQVKAVGAAADGDNCATDATFTCVVIEYV